MMAAALAEQLGSTKLNDEVTDSAWKDKMKLPVKDSRPQTEVIRATVDVCYMLTSLTGCYSDEGVGVRRLSHQT